MLYEYINTRIHVYKMLYIKCNYDFSTASSNGLQNFVLCFGIRSYF